MTKSSTFWASSLALAALFTVSCAGGETSGTGPMGGGNGSTGGSSGGTASGGRVGGTGSGGSGTFGSGGAKTGGSTGSSSGGSTGSSSGGSTGTGSGGATFGSGGAPTTGTNTGGAPTTGTGTGGAPVTGGALTVADGYVMGGTWKGYGYTFTGGTKATITPANFKGMTSLCVSGSIMGDPAYASVAGMGMNVNQAAATTTTEPPANTVATSGTGLTINVGSVTGLMLMPGVGSQLRAQVKTANGDYCAPLPMMGQQTIPWGMFNKTCWDVTAMGNAAFTAGTAIKAVELVVPSSTTAIGPFMFCLLDAK